MNMINFFREFIKFYKFPITFSTLLFILPLLFACISFKETSYTSYETINNQTSHLDYLFQNLKVTFSMIIGVISFGVFSIYLLIINGVLLGESLSLSLEYISFYEALLLIVPHGIFELPAIIISGALGLSLLTKILSMLFRDNTMNFKKTMKFYFFGIFIVIILLFIASLIEYYITPDISQFI